MARWEALKFQACNSLVDPQFWSELGRKKVDEWRLSDEAVAISARFTGATHLSKNGSLPPRIFLDQGSFRSFGDEKSSDHGVTSEDHSTLGLHDLVTEGRLRNANTKEAFKKLDKMSLLRESGSQMAKEMLESMNAEECKSDDLSTLPLLLKKPSLVLNRFELITFADLKKYWFYYWFCFTTVVSKQIRFEYDRKRVSTIDAHSTSVDSDDTGSPSLPPSSSSSRIRSAMMKFIEECGEEWKFQSIFLYQSKKQEFYRISQLLEFTDALLDQSERLLSEDDSISRMIASDDTLHVCIVDNGSMIGNPSSLVRNALLWIFQWLSSKKPKESKDDVHLSLPLLFVRNIAGGCTGSLSMTVKMTSLSDYSTTKKKRMDDEDDDDDGTHLDYQYVGWEKDESGKNKPRKMDLKSMLDPRELMKESTRLNLSLMKWRMVPELKLDYISEQKVLLFGCGTLGCSIARLLLSYGIRTMTLVDNGMVSYSNPVRQSLYSFKDCIHGSTLKVTAAKQALQSICPSVKCKAMSVSIPMPGHSHTMSEDTLKSSIEQCIELVKNHDIIFVLTDSRESRWLPTLLCSAMNKLCVNVALGFDSFLTMRHGTEMNRLGCYFCSDIVAPLNSLADRTLDQQCTVTRPGLAGLASSLAVELCVSVLQSPMRQHCSAPGMKETTVESRSSSSSSSKSTGTSTMDSCSLFYGNVPHQLRGTLSGFNVKSMAVPRFNECAGCSPSLLSAFKKGGSDMIRQCICKPSMIEDLCGLTAMKEQMERRQAEMDGDLVEDWMDDDDFDLE